MFLNESREQISIQEETSVAESAENAFLPKLVIGGIAALVGAAFIHHRRRKHKIEQNAGFETANRRKSEAWSALPQSLFSKNTVYPIGEIADAMSEGTNPKKPMICLYLGDPTITGQLPPSPVAVEALQQSAQSHRHDGYAPSVGELAARQAVVDRYSTPEAVFTADDVILTSGCSHALQMTIETVANSGDNILIPRPRFPLYTILCRPYNIEDRSYNLNINNDGLIDLDHLESLIDDRTKAILVNNPGNPTGVVFPKKHLEAILQLAERYKLTIIADEIYGDLVYGGAVFYPMATLSPKVPIICCDGISKRWNVPGWRLGWLIVHDRHGVLTEVKKGIVALSHKIVGPSSLVQGALPKLLKETPEKYFEFSRRLISSNADIISNILKNVRGLRPLKPQGAMYLMVGIDETLYGDETTFVQKLTQEESLVVFPGTAFSAPGWIRLVLVHSNEDMREAAHRIRRFCERKIADAAVNGTQKMNSCDSVPELCFERKN